MIFGASFCPNLFCFKGIIPLSSPRIIAEKEKKKKEKLGKLRCFLKQEFDLCFEPGYTHACQKIII